MKKLNNFCATFIFLLLAVSAVFTSCADLYDETELDKNELCIASTGSDTVGDGTAVKPYLTLGKALEHINNAGLGSSAEWTIYVLDEVVCHEDISTFTGSKLTLQGINGSCGLNGNLSGSVLKITAPGTFEINKLKITGGTGTNSSGLKGGGIYLDNTNATVIIASDSTVTLNNAQYGAGIYNENGTVVVYGSVTGNTASSGGGGIFNKGTLNLYGSVTSNTSSGGGGGGIYISAGTVNLIGNYSISGNIANAGSGIYKASAATLNGNNPTNNLDITEDIP